MLGSLNKNSTRLCVAHSKFIITKIKMFSAMRWYIIVNSFLVMELMKLGFHQSTIRGNCESGIFNGRQHIKLQHHNN